MDSTPLKTLFPQSITFDCCCTKGKVVNIRVSLRVGGIGVKGRQCSHRLHEYNRGVKMQCGTSKRHGKVSSLYTVLYYYYY